jgi:lambda family phage tail tape measure protein
MATAGELANFGGYGSANSGLGAVQPGSEYTGLNWSNALGGVYDQGRVAFAKGGAFTNSIVTRPTTFAFAKGTGLMGEAGPEAIMPLKRSPNGSLGVQGGGSSVDVVVNNYGQEKATTKQTTDSRGNRRIEVIVGEMTAAEMNRPNSPIQSSMRGTFGIAPQLTRR